MMKERYKAEEYFDCGCVYEEMAEGAMCESCGHTTCIDCSENINTTDANYKNWRCYEGYGCNKGAESFEAPYGRMPAWRRGKRQWNENHVVWASDSKAVREAIKTAFPEQKFSVRIVKGQYIEVVAKSGTRPADIEQFKEDVKRVAMKALGEIYKDSPEELREKYVDVQAYERDFGAEDFDEMWKVIVDESSSFGQTDNPVIRINICRRCGATDNLHDPHIPSQFKHSVDADSCSRCDSFGAEELGAEGINLRKRIEDFIDLREINFTGFKKDTKRDAAKRARRIENELKGVLPKGKSYKVDKPKWFTIAQTGIILGVAGLVGYSGFKGKE